MSNMQAIGEKSAALRAERAKIRRELLNAHLKLADVLADPPRAIHGMTVLAVLQMLRRQRHANAWEQQLGMHAIRDKVNLLVRVEVASQRTLLWAVEHGTWHAQRPRGARKAGDCWSERSEATA